MSAQINKMVQAHLSKMIKHYDNKVFHKTFKKGDWVVLGYGTTIGDPNNYTWAIKLNDYDNSDSPNIYKDYHRLFGSGFTFVLTFDGLFGKIVRKDLKRSPSNTQEWFIIPDLKLKIYFEQLFNKLQRESNNGNKN